MEPAHPALLHHSHYPCSDLAYPAQVCCTASLSTLAAEHDSIYWQDEGGQPNDSIAPARHPDWGRCFNVGESGDKWRSQGRQTAHGHEETGTEATVLDLECLRSVAEVGDTSDSCSIQQGSAM